MKTQNN